MVVTETTRKAIWDGVLESARSTRYFEGRSRYFKKWKIAKQSTASLLGLSIVIFPIISEQFGEPSAICITAFLFIATAVSDLVRTDEAVVLSSIVNDMTAVESKWRVLFAQASAEQIDEETAMFMLILLNDIMHHIGNRTDVSLDKKLLEVTDQETFEAEQQRHV